MQTMSNVCIVYSYMNYVLKKEIGQTRSKLGDKVSKYNTILIYYIILYWFSDTIYIYKYIIIQFVKLKCNI